MQLLMSREHKHTHVIAQSQDRIKAGRVRIESGSPGSETDSIPLDQSGCISLYLLDDGAVFMYICMRVCMCVCVYVCVYVWVSARV